MMYDGFSYQQAQQVLEAQTLRRDLAIRLLRKASEFTNDFQPSDYLIERALNVLNGVPAIADVRAEIVQLDEEWP